MVKTILTNHQKTLLQLFSQQKAITDNFYLSGGTALSEYYLHHRISEDLDFFCDHEIDINTLQSIFQKIKLKIPIQKIEYRQSFNRNLFFVHLQSEVVKTEFTYYPFSHIEKPRLIEGILIDSLVDIAVNKTSTICQNPRSRDFIDLYLIIKKEKWEFSDLLKKSRIKFDTYMDPLQICRQLLKVTELKDYPKMIIPLQPKTWQDFWLKEINKLKKEVLE